MAYKNPPKETQWKKGESGNLAGKPKGTRSLKTLLQEALIKVGEGNAEPYDVLLIKRVMKMAIGDGNEAMIRLVWSYLEGMPVQRQELTGLDGKDLFTHEERESAERAIRELSK